MKSTLSIHQQTLYLPGTYASPINLTRYQFQIESIRKQFGFFHSDAMSHHGKRIIRSQHFFKEHFMEPFTMEKSYYSRLGSGSQHDSQRYRSTEDMSSRLNASARTRTCPLSDCCIDVEDPPSRQSFCSRIGKLWPFAPSPDDHDKVNQFSIPKVIRCLVLPMLCGATAGFAYHRSVYEVSIGAGAVGLFNLACSLCINRSEIKYHLLSGPPLFGVIVLYSYASKYGWITPSNGDHRIPDSGGNPPVGP